MTEPKSEHRSKILARINFTETCWLWTGSIRPNGYGKLTTPDATLSAHRAVYEMVRGPIPPGLDLDHLCRVRHCVNPAHLEPVTRRENLLRGATIPAAHASREQCRKGHPLDGFKRTEGARYCKTCHRERQRARRLRKGAA